MLRIKSLRAVAIYTAAFTFLSAGGCKRGPAPAAFKFPPAAVTVEVAQKKDVPFYLEEIGKTAASEYVTIQPQISGQIKEIHFKDGADLKKGELLFTIDPRPFDAALNQAQANEKQQAAALELAKTDFKRAEELISTKAVSQQEFDQKKNAVAVSEAQVKAAQAAVQMAQLNQEYCEIHSPIDGRAGQRMADVGNIVKANDQPLLIVQRLQPIYVEFTTNEQNLPTIRKHMEGHTLTTRVWIPGETEAPHEGDLTFLDTSVQNGAGTIKLRATLPNKDHYFWAGQYVRVQLILQIKKDAVMVPMQAIQINQKGPYVFVVDDKAIAQPRQIVEGQRQGDWMVIDQGVTAGERVIITGQKFVIPNSQVNVLPSQGVARS